MDTTHMTPAQENAYKAALMHYEAQHRLMEEMNDIQYCLSMLKKSTIITFADEDGTSEYFGKNGSELEESPFRQGIFEKLQNKAIAELEHSLRELQDKFSNNY